jgi:hypothetical protein
MLAPGSLRPFELGVVRQVRSRLVVEIDDVAKVDGRRRRLVLAELPIGRLQIGHVDAPQRLASADRLRIVHGGRNQVVDIGVRHG